MRAYHFLKADMTSSNGEEVPWTVGETRTVEFPERIKICQYGYHSCAELGGLLDYLYGPMLCVNEVSTPIECEDTKQVSASRTLLVAVDVSRQLREFACDCAERALDLVETRGLTTVDPRPRAAVEVARRFARGEATRTELDAARAAAWDAAGGAAWDAARAAAWDAAGGAAWDAAWAAAGAAAGDAAGAAAGAAAWAAARAAARAAAWDAARAAEITWQRQRLTEILSPVAAA